MPCLYRASSSLYYAVHRGCSERRLQRWTQILQPSEGQRITKQYQYKAKQVVPYLLTKHLLKNILYRGKNNISQYFYRPEYMSDSCLVWHYWGQICPDLWKKLIKQLSNIIWILVESDSLHFWRYGLCLLSSETDKCGLFGLFTQAEAVVYNSENDINAVQRDMQHSVFVTAVSVSQMTF